MEKQLNEWKAQTESFKATAEQIEEYHSGNRTCTISARISNGLISLAFGKCYFQLVWVNTLSMVCAVSVAYR